MSRAQLASFIHRLLAAAGVTLTAGDGAQAFTDVGGVHAGAVEALAANGVVRGIGGQRYSPGRSVTRGQVASIIVAAMMQLEVDLPPGRLEFQDVSPDGVHAEAISRLATSGIAVGRTTSRFEPQEPVTRGQAASLLVRTLQFARGEPLGGSDVGEASSEITRHDVTWALDDEYEVGQFANGDFWVVGPVTVTEIDPPFEVVAGGWNGQDWPKNGSMLNPTSSGPWGYGFVHRDESNYDEAVNVAANLPVTIEPGNSLVSTIAYPEPDHRPSLRSASVLTVVDVAPAAGSLRPPYTDVAKTVRGADLNLELLPRLPLVGGETHPDALADEFERLWLMHRTGWKGRKYHPSDAMPDYGRDLTALLGQGYLTLMLDYPVEEKERLAVYLTQIGVDLYGNLETGARWHPNGGHSQGRKLPILFAGLMLDDADMLNVGVDYEMPGPAGNAEEVWFGEDGQTFYVTPGDVDRGVGYSKSDIGLAEWGIRHWTQPHRDDASWGASYRQCCTANSWHSHVLTARILGLQDAWNHDALFDYTDRYMDRQSQDGRTGTYFRSWQRPFSETMWDVYRPQH